MTLTEPQRVSFLLKAREICDDHHAITTTMTTQGMSVEMDKEEQEEVKRCRARAAGIGPSHLQERVIRGEDLPAVEINVSDQQDEVIAGVLEHVVCEGKLVKEVFITLLDMMGPTWNCS